MIRAEKLKKGSVFRRKDVKFYRNGVKSLREDLEEMNEEEKL